LTRENIQKKEQMWSSEAIFITAKKTSMLGAQGVRGREVGQAGGDGGAAERPAGQELWLLFLA
jgi:hypothetical protein